MCSCGYINGFWCNVYKCLSNDSGWCCEVIEGLWGSILSICCCEVGLKSSYCGCDGVVCIIGGVFKD